MDERNKHEEELLQKTGAQFDMYHFFSRKDVILAGILIVLLLLYFVLHALSRGQAA